MPTSDIVASNELTQNLCTLRLEPGDHLTRQEFHERYRQMPDDVRAELIGGIVYMPAALRMPHGRFHMLVNIWLGQYWTASPGTDIADNATILLSDTSEPQPDALMRIIGGQTHENDEGYLVGPPELVVEVASSSESYDLHSKREDYERWGVQEYLVFLIQESRAVWFESDDGKFAELAPAAGGVLKSKVFPGLWLNTSAFFDKDTETMQAVLREGLESQKHSRFVQRLQNDLGGKS